jgi:hypothetical protein
MKYLVDGGRLVWVMASSPEDAARLTALVVRPCETRVLTVYEPGSGYRFPFLFEKTDGVNNDRTECGEANTSRL